MKMVTASNGNMKKAAAGIKRINLDGLGRRVFIQRVRSLGVGRLASHIVTAVQGKDMPTYTPNHDDGDMCIVLHAKDICVTEKTYRQGLLLAHRASALQDQMAKDPTEVIRKAVLRMLPRNKLRDLASTCIIVNGYRAGIENVREMRPRARCMKMQFCSTKMGEQKKADGMNKGKNEEALEEGA
ncbi:hypothetical protein VNO78_04030 [Psophocarpus tetragonolobus]|uniref:50S ribosomal protein L13 n=1 Tax=Psophocarpus tetragonolobus TaxID=3891 RepID=A0AAN9TFJ4_PSOTE